MKSPHYFIIKPKDEQRYQNKNESGIILNTTIEDGLSTQRLAYVVETPIQYKGEVKKGDLVVVHHNTFRTELNNKGVPIESKRHIKDNLFYLEEELIYLIIREDECIATLNYCFVEPTFSLCGITKEVKEDEQYGNLYYVNERQKSLGLNKGTKVGFKPHSKYAFDLFGKKLYMMKDHRILLKL